MRPKNPRWAEFVEAATYWAETKNHSVRHDYSGRAMYGRTCFAIDVSNLGEIAGLYFCVGHAFAKYETEEGDDELGKDDCPDLRTDDMGKGFILYWPSVVMEEGPTEKLSIDGIQAGINVLPSDVRADVLKQLEALRAKK